jgi:hypothetical protein
MAKKMPVNSSAERKAKGRKPYRAPTRKEHPVLAARAEHFRLRGIRENENP